MTENESQKHYYLIIFVDDLLPIIDKCDPKASEKQIIHCIFKTNNLTKLLVDIYECGYEPQIKDNAGRVVMIC